jgi:hypothetical protein
MGIECLGERRRGEQQFLREVLLGPAEHPGYIADRAFAVDEDRVIGRVARAQLWALMTPKR